MVRKMHFKRVIYKRNFQWNKTAVFVILGIFLFLSLIFLINKTDTGDGHVISDEQKQKNESFASIRFVIEIINAWHLDENREVISDIYPEVSALDNVWSETIHDGEYARITFEQRLTSNNDITIYPRIIAGNPRIEIYEKNGNDLIAEFQSIEANQYNKVFLTSLQRSQDTFDLRVVSGSLEFDHIYDPISVVNQYSFSGSKADPTSHAGVDSTGGNVIYVFLSGVTKSSGDLLFALTVTFKASGGDQAFTKIGEAQNVQGTVAIWYLENPDQETANIDIDWDTTSANWDHYGVGVVVLSGVDISPGTPHDSWEAPSTGTGTAVSHTVTADSGDLVYDIATADGTYTTFTENGDGVEVFNIHGGTKGSMGVANLTATGNANMGWTIGASIPWIHGGISINPAAGAPPDNTPTVTLNSPIDFFNSSSSSITFNGTATDDINLVNITLYGNWTGSWVANETNSSPINNTPTTFTKTIADGTYLWNYYACDNASTPNCAFASANRTFTVDSTDPTVVSLDYPSNNSVVNSGLIDFNFTATDNIGLANCTLYTDFGGWAANETVNNPANNTETNITIDPPEGTFIWNVFCEDNLGNSDWFTNNYTINVDSTAPTSTINAPGNDSTTSDNTPDIRITLTDNIANSINYTFYINDSVNKTGTVVNNTPTNVTMDTLADGLWLIVVEATDNASNKANSSILYLTIDTTPPQWFNNLTNSTLAGQTVNHSVNWTDETQLEGYIFSFDNGTGSFVNDSYATFSGTQNFSNVVKVVNSTVSSIIRWRVYTNDTSDNINITDIFQYTTTADNPPKWNNASVDDPTPDPGQTVEHRINWSDDNGLSFAILEVNSSGASCDTTANVTNITLSGTVNWSNLTWAVPNACEGKTIGWRQYANDSVGQWNVTSLQTYTVNNINPIASFGTNPVDNYNSSSQSITFQLSCSDNLGVDELWLYGNWTGAWTVNQTNSSPNNDSVWNIQVNNIPEGKGHIWAAWCNDSVGNSDFTGTNRTFSVDVTAPSLSNENVNDTSITQDDYFCVNITATDSISGVDTVLAEIYNTTAWVNYTMSEDGTSCDGDPTDGIYGVEIQGTAIGTWNYSKVFANDTLGNNNTYDFSDLTVSVTETTVPIVNLNSPIDNYNSSIQSITFNGTASDDVNLKNVTLYGNWTGAWTANQTNSSGINNSDYIFTKTIPEGRGHIWNYYACDTSDNCAFASNNRTFTIDLTNPAVTISEPQAINYTTNALTINFTATDDNLASCWYTNDSGDTNYSLLGCANTTYTAAQNSTTIIVYANDSAGNLNDTEQVTFFIDSIYPSIEFTTGTEDNDTAKNQQFIFVNVSVTETNFGNITYKLFNSTGPLNETTYTSLITTINWTGLNNEDVRYWYNVSIYDSVGNFNQTETRYINLTADQPPTVTIDYPQNTTYNTNVSQLNYSADDDNSLSACWYSTDGGATNLSVDPTCSNFTGVSSSEGINNWTVYVNDTAGQESSDIVFFTKDTIYPTFSSHARNPNPPNEDQSVQVNVTITEDNLGTVILEFNNNTAINYTVTTSNGNEYYFTILSGNYTAHDSVNYTWFANDSAGNLNQSSLQSFTVSNQIPTVSAPAINDTTPLTNEFISCDGGTFSDDDEEDTEQTRFFLWYDTDIEISGQTSQTLNLSISGLDKADVIKCSVSVYDGYDNSSWVNSSNNATIQNSPPVITTPQTTVSWDANGSTYSYDYNATDDDGDTLTWYDNTTLFDINSSTGEISDIPTESEAGSYSILINVSDSTDQDTDSFTYTINDITYPLMNIIYPSNTNYTVNVSELNYSYTETNPDKCWYSNNSGATNLSIQACGINFTDVVSVEGSNTWIVYINDTAGNENSSSVTFTKDTQDPSVVRNSPLNQTYDTTSILFNVTATDGGGISSCWYSLNAGATNFSLTNSGDDWTDTNASMTQGSQTANYYCNDTSGNLNDTEQVTFFIDSINPLIDINYPANNSNLSVNSLNITGTASDLNNVSIVINNSNFGTNQGDYANWNFTNSSLNDGTYVVNITANDTVGNKNNAILVFTIDTTNPSISYNPTTDADSSFVNRDWVFVNISATDDNLEGVRMEFDGTNETFAANSGNNYWENKTSLSDGNHSFYAWVNDSAGNFNSTSNRTVTIDTTNSLIDYTTGTPVDNANLTQDYIFVNVSLTETNFQNITFRLYNSTTLVNETTYTTETLEINWTSQPDEVYTYNITIVDKAINENSTATRTVTLDTGSPSMNYVSPTETSGVTKGQNFIEINVTASDPKLDKILIKLYNSTNFQINSSTTSTSPNYINFTNLADGQYFYNATANDTFGNEADLATRNITLDTINPSVTSLTESPTDPATYSGGATYQFNATITDDNLDTVLIEFDGVNYTPSNLAGDVYNLTMSDLAAGIHNYTWFANDSAGSANITSSDYTINNATGDITLLINGSASNQTGVYGIQTNASASTTQGTITLYRNGTDVTSENNAFVTLAVNYYNYTAVSSGNQNYTSVSTTLFVNISKAASEVNLTLNVTDGNVTIVQDSSIYLNVTTITGDSNATLRLYNAGTLINQGIAPLSNLTTFNTIGVFNITGYYLSSENYTGSFETWWVNVTETPDLTNPSVTSLTESPTDPATYTQGATYEFNATITDNREIDTVLFEFDSVNYTPSNLSLSNYNVTFTDLAVGTYNYRWYANDTASNSNNTENGTYTINQTTPSLSLVITPSTSETYGTETTANGTGCPSQLTCNLYRSGVLVNNSDTQTLGVGTYNYIYNTTGNTNYTSYSNSSNLTITQNTGTCGVSFNESSGITYGTIFRVWTNCTSGFVLYRNSSVIDNNSEQSLGTSSYNFTVIRNDTVNYSNYYDEETFIVNQETGVVFTYLNNSRANITIEQFTEIYLNGTLETGVGTIELYKNETLINQGASPLFNLTNFTTIGLYNITTIYDGNTNYTSAFETWWVNVSEADVTAPNINITYPQNTSYTSIQTQLNYTASDNFGLNICWYSNNSGATNTTIACGTNVTGLNSGQGSSTWIVYANDSSGNENSSSVTFFIDSINPEIQFVSPTETSGDSLGRNYIQVNVTASDTNPDKITIRLYNSSNSLIRENTSSATSPFFINYTGLTAGNYFFNATTNDTVGNENSTATRNVSLVTPTLTIINPENETYITNESLLLEYTVSLEDSVWYNIDSGNNTTITGNTTFNTTEGGHTLYLYANNSVGETVKNVTFTVNITKFGVTYNEYAGLLKGLSTAFNQSSNEDLQNLSDIILERINAGRIRFNTAINVTDDLNLTDNKCDLGLHTNISSNRIELNSTALPNFNVSATLYLYNLTFSNPRILKDGAVCSPTICTGKNYSGNTLSFNVTGFSVYSAEETPTEDTLPSGGGGGDGEVYECSQNNECEQDETCWNHQCTKLFDIKILDFESPIKLGDFFDFTYLVKGAAIINDDVKINFWIERDGEIITSGSDVIYLGSFEERTETTKIFLPSGFKSGVYEFHVQVVHPSYSAESHRTIEIEVREDIVTIIPIDIENLKTYIVFGLIILALLILSTIFYLERKKIKKSIERGFAQETRWFKKYKISILISALIVILGVLAYSLNLSGFLAAWFRSPSFNYFLKIILVLFGLLVVILILNKTNFFQRFKAWRIERRAINQLRRAKRRETERLKREKIRHGQRKVIKVRPKTKASIERPRRDRKFMKAFIKIITSPIGFIEKIAIALSRFSGKVFRGLGIFFKAIRRKTTPLVRELKVPEITTPKFNLHTLFKLKKEKKTVKKVKKPKPTKKRKPKLRILFKLKRVLRGFYEWSKEIDRALLKMFKKTPERFEISKFWNIGKKSPQYLIPEQIQKELGGLGKLEKSYRKTELNTVKIIKNSMTSVLRNISNFILPLGSLIAKKEKEFTKAEGRAIKQIHEDIFYLLKKIFGRKSHEKIVHDFEHKLVKTGKFTRRHLEALRNVVDVRLEFKKTKSNLYHDVARIGKESRVLIRDLKGYLYGLDKKEKKEIRRIVSLSKRRSTNLMGTIKYDLRNTLNVIHNYLIKINVFYLRARYNIKMKFLMRRREIVQDTKELEGKKLMEVKQEAARKVEEILKKKRVMRKKRVLEKEVFEEKVEKPEQVQKKIERPKPPIKNIKKERYLVIKSFKKPEVKIIPKKSRPEIKPKETVNIIQDIVEKEKRGEMRKKTEKPQIFPDQKLAEVKSIAKPKDKKIIKDGSLEDKIK